MIGWQNPAAFWALPLAAVPIVIHLLRTHHARRLAFPSLRFVPASRTAAVRIRLPSDLLLMLLRIAVVALAIGALAGPILLTDARTGAWNARTSRAVVVDSSDSMRVAEAGAVPLERAATEAAAAELQTATYGRRIDARDLEEGVARAARWLATSPPARREVVVVSDMQRGALPASEGWAVGDGVGLRFVAVGRPATATSFDGVALFGAGDVPPRAQAIEATPDGTAVAIESRPGGDRAGLRISVAAGEEAHVAGLLRAVALAGAPQTSAQEPVAFQFPGARPATVAAIRAGWMLRAILRLRRDSTMSGISGTSGPSAGDTVAEPWTVLARSGTGAPLARAAASGEELVFDVGAPIDSLEAAAIVRAVLTARQGRDGYAEHEIARVDAATLSALTRPAGPVTREAWRTADTTDARWFWLLAIALLGAEQWLRGRSRRQTVEVIRAAA